MTAEKLIVKHKQAVPNSHFFDKDTLKFFGERISEMIVWKKLVNIKDYHGEMHKCYVLSSLQRNHPCGASRSYHYFDSETFEEVID